MKTFIVVILSLALTSIATSATGVSIDFGGAIPKNVRVDLTGVWRAGGLATFHNGAASRMTVKLTLPAGAPRWKLRVSDSGRPASGEAIYVRPIISVNGKTVASDVVLWSADRTRTVNAPLRAGANTIVITLSADSQSFYQLRSLQLGP